MYLFTKLFLRIIRMNNRFVFGISVLFLVLCTWGAYALEPDTFGNPFNGFWWVMTTVTTVGYGDFYPHTLPGKCLGILLYLFGIGLISIVISKSFDGIFSYQRKKEEGRLRYTGRNHYVIIGWSTHAELAIKEILGTDDQMDVVLIDTLEKTPFPHERVHFVQGDPVQDAALEQTNLGAAKAVFIFADEVTQFQNVIRDPSFIDGKTLLIATAVERNYSQVYTVVEIKDKANLQNFQHIQVDEFILGQDMISQLAVRSAFQPGTSKILAQLLTRDYGEDLFEIKKQPHWRTYRDAFEELLEQGATLISDGTDLGINRRLDDTIPDQARLFIICDLQTYRRLTAAPTIKA